MFANAEREPSPLPPASPVVRSIKPMPNRAVYHAPTPPVFDIDAESVADNSDVDGDYVPEPEPEPVVPLARSSAPKKRRRSSAAEPLAQEVAPKRVKIATGRRVAPPPRNMQVTDAEMIATIQQRLAGTAVGSPNDACPACQKSFGDRMPDLKRHMRTHIAKHIDCNDCGACGQTFSRRDARARHIKNNAACRLELLRQEEQGEQEDYMLQDLAAPRAQAPREKRSQQKKDRASH